MAMTELVSSAVSPELRGKQQRIPRICLSAAWPSRNWLWMLPELLVKKLEACKMIQKLLKYQTNEQLLILWLLTNLSQIKMKTLRKDVQLD